jgi:glutaredoxin
LAAPGDIRMLSSTTCAYCAAARHWLQQHGVRFGECFIETDADCAAQYQAARAPGTPVLLVAGQAQLGFNAQRVHDALTAQPARKLKPG